MEAKATENTEPRRDQHVASVLDGEPFGASNGLVSGIGYGEDFRRYQGA